MIPMSLADLAAVVGGVIRGAPGAVLVDGPVTTDSREVGPGALFVARAGEHADGHDFVTSAAEQGAVAALVEREVPGLPCVVVDDTERAFGRLARAVVDGVPGLIVVGVTGSSGKTTTKDLLGAVLQSAAPTVAPIGSYNSEVGVPLTVCRVRPETRYLVAEMGARGVGHIAYLTEIAPPQVGVVLNVGSAHLGEFGSREAIGRAKSELVAALPADGLAVLNADDEIVRGMAAVTAARVVLVGEHADADLRAAEVDLDRGGRARFLVTDGERRRRVHLPFAGRHQVNNALSVLAVALEVGISLDDACAALESATLASRWRMEVTERTDGVTVVNDAYNANPESMAAALAALQRMGQGRRSWAVLGTMLELGAESDALHAAVGSAAVGYGVDELVVVGATAAPIADGAMARSGSVAPIGGVTLAPTGSSPAASGVTRVRAVADVEVAEILLRAELTAGDVVLFKSSRDAGLRWLGDRLTEMTVEDPT
ncbi:MAG: UDP-N-acetylmuramoyl-tripeptide--D-alanyl-D-alanine ligase [Dermatophilaceae bacterium]